MKIEPSPEAIDLSTEVINQGGILVFPWGKLERRCLAFMCDGNNLDVCRRVNLIKNRPPDQFLAVNGYPELTGEIAKIEDSRPLMRAAEYLQVKPLEILKRLMSRGAISFIFEARAGLPEILTKTENGRSTVMIAGEVDNTVSFDFYTELVRALHKKDIITAGSSANRTQEGTYHVFEQERAYQDLAPDIDLFIYHDPLPPRPIYARNLESCTTFDMTGNRDIPEVVRFGSVHPVRFKDLTGGYMVSPAAKYLPRHENWRHILLKYPFYLMQSFRHVA